MQVTKSKVLCFLISGVLLSVACTKGGGGGSDDGGDGGNTGVVAPGRFRTNCGVVVEGTIENPVESDESVGIEVLSPNSVSVNLPTGRLLVRLQGLGVPPSFLREGTMSRLRALAAGGQGFYFQALSDPQPCTSSVEGGGTAVVGQVLTADGRSYTEEIINSGFGQVSTSDGCGGDLLADCLLALDEDAPQIGGTVDRFLWKPVSENDGNLVILVDEGGANVEVNGVQLVDSGPSNGFGTTARANRTGCSFGGNAKVKVTTRNGEILLFPGGAFEFNIPNGCDRVEYG